MSQSSDTAGNSSAQDFEWCITDKSSWWMGEAYGELMFTESINYFVGHGILDSTYLFCVEIINSVCVDAIYIL